MDEYKTFVTGEATVDVTSPNSTTEFTNFDDEVARLFKCLTNLPDDPERGYPAWIDNEFHEVIRSLSEHSRSDYQDNPDFYPFFMTYLNLEFGKEESYGTALELFDILYANNRNIPLLPFVKFGICNVLSESLVKLESTDCCVDLSVRIDLQIRTINTMLKMRSHEKEMHRIIWDNTSIRQVTMVDRRLGNYLKCLLLQYQHVYPLPFSRKTMFDSAFESIRMCNRNNIDDFVAEDLSSCFYVLITLLEAEPPKGTTELGTYLVKDFDLWDDIFIYIERALGSGKFHVQLAALNLLRAIVRFDEQRNPEPDWYDSAIIRRIMTPMIETFFMLPDENVMISYAAIRVMTTKQIPIIVCEVLREYFKHASAARIHELINPNLTSFFTRTGELLTCAPFEVCTAVLKTVEELLTEKPIEIAIAFIEEREFLHTIMDLLDTGDENLMRTSLTIIKEVIQITKKPMVPQEYVDAVMNALLYEETPFKERLDMIDEETAGSLNLTDTILEILSMLPQEEE